MTLPDGPSGRARNNSNGPADLGAPASPPNPELVLSQALRAMAGGPRPSVAIPVSPAAPAKPRLSVLQILLIAALVGVFIGGTAGLLSLVL